MLRHQWEPAEVEAAIEVLGAHSREQYPEALAAISARLGFAVEKRAMKETFRRRGLGTPRSYLERGAPVASEAAPGEMGFAGFAGFAGVGEVATPAAAPSPETPDAPRFAALVDACRRGPVTFSDLCNKLDLSPAKAEALVTAAREAGYTIDVSRNEVAWKLPDTTGTSIDVAVPPTVGERHQIGVISDIHFGSKWCMRSQLREFVGYAYEKGVRLILSPGDWLDGVYRHSLYEQSHRGFDEQADDAFETLPQMPGLRYISIGGNHDQTLTDQIGMDAMRALAERFRSRGRHDLTPAGSCGAVLRLRDARGLGPRVELWHPMKGAGYSLSYQLQNHVRDYGVGQKPDILLAGHWHVFCYLVQRGVHALACGTFQGNGSAFSKRLGGAPAIGGQILSYELTEHGTLRAFQIERRDYYEHERDREVETA